MPVPGFEPNPFVNQPGAAHPVKQRSSFAVELKGGNDA